MGMVDYRFRAVLDEEFAKSNHLAVGPGLPPAR